MIKISKHFITKRVLVGWSHNI